MRTVFLGTSEFAAAILQRLAESPHRPELTVTRPDRPRGRGRKLAAPPVAERAHELGLELAQPESINDEAAVSLIAAARPDVVCVCAFGALIKDPLLSSFPILNVHPSLLPRWRGAAPIERAIMAGDAETGVSIMELTAGLDSGPVSSQLVGPIHPQDTYGSLSERLAVSGGELLVAALERHPPSREQDESLATYAEKITPADRWLDPHRPAAESERTVRALTPHIGAFVLLGPEARLGVREARLIPGGSGDSGDSGGSGGSGDSGGSGGGQPGIRLDGPRPVLETVDGSLELTVVQPPGGRPMSGEDYLRGHPR